MVRDSQNSLALWLPFMFDPIKRLGEIQKQIARGCNEIYSVGSRERWGDILRECPLF